MILHLSPEIDFKQGHTAYLFVFGSTNYHSFVNIIFFFFFVNFKGEEKQMCVINSQGSIRKRRRRKNPYKTILICDRPGETGAVL